MNRSDFNKSSIKPLLHKASEVPHLVLEANMNCNIRCAHCYKSDYDLVKTLDEVKKEIDTALKLRKLESISILGGEPTLHPDIFEIIKYIKSKNIFCIILTNGVNFLNDKEDILIHKLIEAGLDRVVLHIDYGQTHIHDDIEESRLEIFDKLEEKKILFGLSITINPDHETIPMIMKKYSKYKYFEGMLTTLYMDPEKITNKEQYVGPKMLDMYKDLTSNLKIEPANYIPSNLSNDTVCWLQYMYYINSNTYETFETSPLVSRILRKIYYWYYGRHLFGMKSDPTSTVLLFTITGLLELILNPARFFDFIKVIRKSFFGKSLRFQFIILQKGPEFRKDKNEIQICRFCPDATIRNGYLTPVCISDWLNPIGKKITNLDSENDLLKSVIEHLLGKSSN